MQARALSLVLVIDSCSHSFCDLTHSAHACILDIDAGLNWGLSQHAHGLLLSVVGYSQKVRASILLASLKEPECVELHASIQHMWLAERL